MDFIDLRNNNSAGGNEDCSKTANPRYRHGIGHNNVLSDQQNRPAAISLPFHGHGVGDHA